MTDLSPKILLLGSKVKISNIPVKEVSLLEEGSLPAYGYNPGDDIDLLAGKISIENGRLEQCLTWLASYLTDSELTPRLNSVAYGNEKEVYQIFKKRSYRQRRSGDKGKQDHGWFMVNQMLPAKGRGSQNDPFAIADYSLETISNNNGIVLIDDSGVPPQVCDDIVEMNPDLWCLAIGISVAHWQKWANKLQKRFTLFCRLSDLETTRMEMDSSVNWETIVAMCLRALRTPEVGLWDSRNNRFLCHIIVEMFPHGILYIGPEGTYFRYRKGHLPEKSAPRQRGSVPCYDTMVTSMLAMDAMRFKGFDFCRNYFFDFSKRVLLNWNILYEFGYFFDEGLEFPNLDFSSTYPGGLPCSFLDNAPDPTFVELPSFSADFDTTLDLVAGQVWNENKKKALRSFFRSRQPGSSSLSYADPSYDYLDVIVSVLHYLKEEVNLGTGFDNLSTFQIGHLRTTDPAEIDPVITLHNVMDSYVSKSSVLRPLCIGVFGPPGSGKSFAVTQVANAISKNFEGNPFDLCKIKGLRAVW